MGQVVDFGTMLKDAKHRQSDDAQISELAQAALSLGREDEALPLLQAASEQSNSARAWQWRALLERALDEHEAAISSFAKASQLAPGDVSIAHGRARIALEAGLPAGALFEAALRLAPNDPQIFLGYVASLAADGRPAHAETALENAVSRSPMWLDGHLQLAQLRSTIGKKDLSTQSLERAIAAHPLQEGLWIALFNLLVQTQRFEELADAVGRARLSVRTNALLNRYETIAAIENRKVDIADALIARMSTEERSAIPIWILRHQLRTARFADAKRLLDVLLNTEHAPAAWPYAAVAWRVTDDPRWEWLRGDMDRLVTVVDLTGDIPDFPALEQSLRALHRSSGEFLDQSVRGGSQTDGPLFTRIDPAIRQLRSAVVKAVESYVRNLGPVDPAHPLLRHARGRRVRFAGSWSVLLREGGQHSNHVHPEGWISSAFYVHLPDGVSHSVGQEGWLALGEPQSELGLDLGSFKMIEPKVGHLALFPSYMWHGTRTFPAGDRLTVAFDVAPPP